MHPVFHISVLKPWISGGQEVFFRPSPVDFDENEFEVDRIVNERWNQRRKRREFLIRWKGYTSDEDSWEPLENLEGCQDILNEWSVRT